MDDGRGDRAATAAGAGEVFVGRSPELSMLGAVLGEAAAGSPRLVVVGGEPGIGKSRLLDEFARSAAKVGASVHWGRCREAGGAPPYWPWIQTLRGVVRRLDDGALRDAVGPGGAAVLQVLPEIAQRLPDLEPAPELDPDAARFRLFDALARIVSAGGAVSPQVILLDDVHVADEPSLLFLEFLAAELRDCSVLLVAASRTTEVVRSERLAALLHDLDRVPMVRRLGLGRLGPEEVRRYLAVALGEDPSPQLVARVAEQSDGNPLFLGEIARLVVAEQGAAARPAANERLVLPGDVRDTILRRAAHVSAACNEVLRVAAVIGRDVDVELLRIVTDGTDEEVADALDEAERATLLSSAADAPGRLRFTHALVRDALYFDLSSRRRTALHRRVGLALEMLHADAPEPVLGELALHFFEAAPIGEARRAVDYARAAAERAARQLAYEEACRLLEHALQALEVSRDHEPETRCDLLVALGDAQVRAGDLPAAQQVYLRAAEIARAHGFAEQLARVALGYGGWYIWSAVRGDPHFVPLIRDALDALGPGDSPLRVQLLARYAGGAMRDEVDRHAVVRMCDEAVAMARRLDDPATYAYALDGRLGGLIFPDNAQERLELGTEIIELGAQIGSRDRVHSGRNYRCLAAIELADRRLVDAELDALRRLAEDVRSPAMMWSVRVFGGTLALLDGRLDEAEEHIAAAFELSRAQSPDAPTVYWLQLLMLRREQGRADELRRPLEEHAVRYPTRPLYRYALAHLHAVTGREREAMWALEALAADDFDDLPRNDEWLLGMSLLADAIELVEDRRRAARAYDLLRPFERRIAFAALVVACGAVARPLGVLAKVLGRFDDAERHFAVAVEVNERFGAHLWSARSRYDWARMLLATGGPAERDRARELLAEAAAVAGAVGSVDLGQRIAALGQRAAAVGGPALTRRMHRDGDSWAVEYDGASFRTADTKGMRYLAWLLARPHDAVHVLELVTVASPELARTGAESSVTTPVLDARAKAEYQARLAELDAEVDEAEAWGDRERAARAREEIQALAEQVASALGRPGHDRRFASPSERARQSVTKAVRSAIDRLGRTCPSLARDLGETISTGTFCAYTPTADAPPWRVD